MEQKFTQQMIDPKKAFYRKATHKDVNRIEEIRDKESMSNAQLNISDIIEDEQYHIQVIEQDNKLLAYYILERTNEGNYEVKEKRCVPCEGRYGQKIIPFCINLNQNLAYYKDLINKNGNLCDICKNLAC